MPVRERPAKVVQKIIYYMRELREYLRENVTPLNTMGAGNPVAIDGDTVYCEPLCQKKKRNGKKRKKYMAAQEKICSDC